MAQLIVTVPDAQVARVRDAFVGTYAYPATVLDGGGNPIPNPETSGQFVLRKLREHIKVVVVAYEAQLAGDTARAAKVTEVESAITLS